MRLGSILVDGKSHLCSVTSGGVLDLTKAASTLGEGKSPRSIDEALGEWNESLEWLTRFVGQLVRRPDVGNFLSDVQSAKFLPPLISPSKILCVFVNYHSHGQEIGGAPTEPVFFFKHSRCIVGDGDEVFVPKFSAKADHEVELALIIGKEGKDIQPVEAYGYVAGYTVLNDISFRDGMKRGVEGTVLGRNLYRGKVADTSLPLGPYIVTRDEIPNPYPLKLALRVNGEARQDGTTNDMIFKIPDLISGASEDNTLLPGDIIATGTCSGVGLYTGKYLNDGDLVEAEVENVGILRSRIRFRQAKTT
ncbi:MAG: fumarylacetoacetate hydrolase family protein [Thaumarchaeota archaeon]|nr:fumarylacetoacetate hydrolase family protein [Nitrososphaerota archaeon]